MTRWTRARAAVKWSAAVLAAVIGAAWTMTLWVGIGVLDSSGAGNFVGLQRGCLVWSRGWAVRLPGEEWSDGPAWHVVTRDPGYPLQWRYTKRVHQGPPRSWGPELPLWMPFVCVGGLTGLLWWWDRRVRPGHCPCGYSLAGLVERASCPECGHQRA